MVQIHAVHRESELPLRSCWQFPRSEGSETKLRIPNDDTTQPTRMAWALE